MKHPLSALTEDELRALLAYYREQEKAGALKIKASDFRDGELLVVNYTDEYNETTAPKDWDWRMELARGSVFFKKPGIAPEVVIQAMPKFHGIKHCPEAEQHVCEDGPVTIMQKHDGSCVSLTCFRGEVLIFTRGAWQNLQTRLARELISEASMAGIGQMEGHTLVAELIHFSDGKVEQDRGPDRLVLLYATAFGEIVPVTELGPIAAKVGFQHVACQVSTGQELMRQVEVLDSVSCLQDMREGFVAEISGKKYKVKPKIYKTIAGNPSRPSQVWMNRCFLNRSSLAEVQADVEAMEAGPLDYSSLAKALFQEFLQEVDEIVTRLRNLHSSFPGPRELNQSSVSKADKQLLYPCFKCPIDNRDAWFDTPDCKWLVAQSLARDSKASDEARGFAVCRGRLVLCGAPGKKQTGWAEGLDCIVTLLRADELKSRGLDVCILAPEAEWLHLPISGARLEGDGDRNAVKDAAWAVRERLKAGKTVAVHCSAGLHRTGVVGYLTLRLLGKTMGETFELLGQIRWETRAELEKIYFRKESTTPDAPANLISVAEDLLPEMPLPDRGAQSGGYA